MHDENHIEPRPMTKKEMADLYGVSVRTLNKWIEKWKKDLQEINNHSSKILTVAQVKFIFRKLDEP